MKLLDVRPNLPADCTLARDLGPLDVPNGGGRLYPLSDGRWLHLPAPAASALADLKLDPGDSFRVCLQVDGPGVPYWSVWRGSKGGSNGRPRPGSGQFRSVPFTSGRGIPMNLAFREICAFVKLELAAAGQTWGDQAVQDLVSTLFIAASKAGWLAPWERGSTA